MSCGKWSALWTTSRTASFELICSASLRLPGDVVLRQDGVGVRFTPNREAVVPTVVELRETVSQAQGSAG